MRLFSLNAEQQTLDMEYAESDHKKIHGHLIQQQNVVEKELFTIEWMIK